MPPKKNSVKAEVVKNIPAKKSSLFKKASQISKPQLYDGDQIFCNPIKYDQSPKIESTNIVGDVYENEIDSFVDTKSDIKSILFGILSADEILTMSVCNVYNSKLSGEGSIYDERMGSMNEDLHCVTCSLTAKDCPGHFGHIELNACILHPLYYKYILNFLKCFCCKCYKILLSKDQIALSGFDRYKYEARLLRIIEKVESIKICKNCETVQPKYTLSNSDLCIMMAYHKKKDVVRYKLSSEDIKRVFDNVSDSDVELLGFDPKCIHPKNLILTVLPVLPPISRPYVIVDGITCDDDLTLWYQEIIKINNHILDNKKNNISETMIQKSIQTLKFRIKTLIDNNQGKAKHNNGRAIKAIRERLSGKDGLLRGNLMGKRVNGSGRTVIGPDTMLKMGEIVVPEVMASTLTIPEKVCHYNINLMSKLVDNGKANFVLRESKTDPNERNRINLKYALHKKGTELLYGDIIIRGKSRIVVKDNKISLKPGDLIERDGTLLDKVEYPCKKEFKLRLGDIVERHLMDGDIVLFNRQPTLWKGSTMAHKVLVKPYKTLRFNLCNTKSYNADYDGDEMNIHISVSPQSKAELELISATKYHLINAQSSRPGIVIVQDSLLGIYLMTRENQLLAKDRFFNLCMHLDISLDVLFDKLNHIREILTLNQKDPNPMTTRGLISLLLPNTLNYKYTNNAISNEPTLIISKGVLIEGAFNKSTVGGGGMTLIQILFKEYSIDQACTFIDHIQFITNAWMIYNGFTIGIQDCMNDSRRNIDNAISKVFIEATAVEENTIHPIIKEVRINSSLGKAKDIGMKISKDSMAKDNHFVTIILSGSKGDFFNIAQISGLLGQQNIKGHRIEKTISGGKRTLPHYSFTPTKAQEYESRGFIKNSFIKGLNPKEFWFHTAAGREGICNTSTNTSLSGYLQRKLIKVQEDLVVQYDNTVRTTNGCILQMMYGEDGLDGSQSVILGDTAMPCNIERLVDKINMEYEGEK